MIYVALYNIYDNELNTKKKKRYCEADKNTSIKWKFFERFKMSLYDKNIKKLNIIDDNEEKEIDEADISNELTATNGDKCVSEKIFIIAFQHLQKLSKEYLHKITSDEIDDDEIQWILTVPAIWSENAKNKMKEWIIKAGLVDATIKNQCIIVYEPDCAALALKQQLINNLKSKMKIPMLTNPTLIDDDDDEKQDGKKEDNWI